jgi:hypothetical protein
LEHLTPDICSHTKYLLRVDLGTFPYMANSFDLVADDDVTEEVPPPELNPEGKKQDQVRAGIDDARLSRM